MLACAKQNSEEVNIEQDELYPLRERKTGFSRGCPRTQWKNVAEWSLESICLGFQFFKTVTYCAFSMPFLTFMMPAIAEELVLQTPTNKKKVVVCSSFNFNLG